MNKCESPQNVDVPPSSTKLDVTSQPSQNNLSDNVDIRPDGVSAAPGSDFQPVYPSVLPSNVDVDWLTKDWPDTEYFLPQEKTFNRGFNVVWTKLIDWLTKSKYDLALCNRDKGVVVTNYRIKKIFSDLMKDQYAIVVQKTSDSTTKLIVKGFCWFQWNGAGSWDRIDNRTRSSSSFLSLLSIAIWL